jgi:hypothetical protein
VVAPNEDELVFQIRAPADELKADLAKGVAEVEKAAREMAAVETKIPLTVDTSRLTAETAAAKKAAQTEIKVPTTVDAAKLKSQVAVTRQLAQAEADKQPIRVPLNADSEARRRFQQTRGQGAAPVDDDEGPGAFTAASRGLRQIGRVATVATAAIEALDVAGAGYELITANISGNYEDQVKSAKEAHDVIGDIPIIGGKIVKLGETINRYTIEQVTHEQEYVEKIKAATVEQDKHTASLARHAAAKEKFNAELAGFADTTSAAGFSVSATDEEKAKQQIDALKKRLADYIARPEAKNKFGQLTEQAKSEVARIQQGIRQIEFAKATKDERDTRASEAEAAALRAEAAGKKELAETLRFEEERKKAEEAAAKRGAEFLPLEKEKTKLKRQQLEAQQALNREEATRKVVAEANKEIDVKARDRAERDKAEADQQAREDQRSKAIDARLFDASQVGLRASGRNQEADIERIKHQAIEDLRAAGGDEELKRAIEADVSAQLQAVEVKGSRATAGSQVQAFSASQANLISFSPQNDTKNVAKNTERANTILEQILTEARKPRAAVTV